MFQVRREEGLTEGPEGELGGKSGHCSSTSVHAEGRTRNWPVGVGPGAQGQWYGGHRGEVVLNVADQSHLEMGLTRMPSNRDRARSGRRARRVRRALMDAMSEYFRIFAMRLVSDI